MNSQIETQSVHENYLPPSLLGKLPTMVKSQLVKMPAQQQSEFVEEFQRKAKSTPVSYLCSLLYCHYGYVGRWGMTVVMWLVAICTLGIGGLIWWLVDLFRIPGIVRNANHDIAVQVLRDMKIISG